MTKKKRDLSNVPPEYLMVAQLIQISALMNILGGLLATLLGMAVCVSTYGCCFPFIFMGIPSVIVGAFELQWGTTASNGHRVRDLKQKSLWGLGSSVLLVFAAPMIGLPSLLLEIVVQTRLNDRALTRFLRGETSPETPLLTDDSVT